MSRYPILNEVHVECETCERLVSTEDICHDCDQCVFCCNDSNCTNERLER